MIDNSDFFTLLKYSSTGELDDYTEIHAKRELEYYLHFCNENAYDIIDYERLIYIELRFKNNEQLMEQLQTLKNKICQNYLIRQKLLNKFTTY